MKQLLLLLLCFGLASVQANTLIDPTRPSPHKSMLNTDKNSKDMTSPGLTLSAIINNNHSRQAIINGISFAEGQQIQGYKVVLISQNHVLLDGSDGKKTLFVNNNNIRKDANDGF